MPSKGRRGTKDNPFELGEKVRLKKTGQVVEVHRISFPCDLGAHISYLVCSDDVPTTVAYARDLEEHVTKD